MFRDGYEWLKRKLGFQSQASLDGNWLVVSFGPGSEARRPLEGSEPRIVIEGGRIAGTTGLNRIGGQFQGDFPLTPLAVTRMAGPPALMEQEGALLGWLQRADGFHLDGDILNLVEKGEMVIVLRRSGTG